VDAGHDVGVPRLADAGDPAVLDPDVGLVDPGPVDDEGVGDHAVEPALIVEAAHLAHAVAQDLAAAD